MDTNVCKLQNWVLLLECLILIWTNNLTLAQVGEQSCFDADYISADGEWIYVDIKLRLLNTM